MEVNENEGVKKEQWTWGSRRF